MFSKLGIAKNATSSGSTTSLQTLDYTNHDDHPLELSLNIESPPCVLYGCVTESSGTLLGGLLTVTVNSDADVQGVKSNPLTPVSSDQRKHLSNPLTTSLSHLGLSHSHTLNKQKSHDNLKRLSSMSNIISPPRMVSSVQINSVELSLVQKVHYEKPFRPPGAVFSSCTNCKNKITEFHRWTIIENPTELVVGKHSFPFSHLIPGNLPTTTHLGSNAHTTIKYELVAVVTYKHPFKGKGDSSKRILQLNLPIQLTRSIIRGSDKTSLRVFPPTDLTANAVLPNVVYPKSTFSMELKLDGVCSEDRRWRMRKLNWRIEEKVKVRAHSCQAHKAKLKQLEEKVKQDEEKERQLRKNVKPIKRTIDMGPQVKMTVNSFQDVILQQLPRSDSISGSGSSDNRPNGGLNPTNSLESSVQDEDHDTIPDTSTDFIHPNDDAMRQEILLQQQRLRQQLLEQELKQESSLYTEEIRTIASGELKSGWKSDFTGKGTIELVTDIDCMRLNSGVMNPVSHVSTKDPYLPANQDTVNVSCDIEDTTLGVYVSHLLFVEIIVAEEQLQNVSGHNGRSRKGSTASSSSKQSKPKNNADQRLAELSPIFADRPPQPVVETHTHRSSSDGEAGDAGSSKVVGVPTGAARVLRMQFRLIMTERSGLGISWDDEVPPPYQDIRLLTPPCYEDSPLSPLDSASLPMPANSLNKHDDRRARAHAAQNSRSSSSVNLASTIRPPPALHHSSSNSLTFQFGDLDHVMSIQGAEPGFNSALTPQNTRTINVPTISEMLDTDRITQ